MYVFPRLMGGIGNRMFQVAAAYGYGDRYSFKSVLVQDMIEPNRYTTEDHQRTIFRRCQIVPTVRNANIFNEPSHLCFSYINLAHTDNNLYLHGYFQNEKYFNRCRDKILDLFRMEESRRDYLTKKYDFENAMFIHIRTYTVKHSSGEVEVAHNQHKFDLSKYLQRALKHIELLDVKPKFYLLTDCYELCNSMYKSILSSIDVTLIDENELNSLYFMSLCQLGGICSNSSFSWWGSYLNESENKIVIMPDKWLRQPWECSIQPKNAIIAPVD